MGCDIADGELEVRVAEGRKCFQRVVKRLLGDHFLDVRQGLDLLDQSRCSVGMNRRMSARWSVSIDERCGTLRKATMVGITLLCAPVSPRKFSGAVSTPS